MYLGVHYDWKKNNIYHKYIDEEGKRRTEKISPKYTYYIEDTTKKSSIKDIFGTPVVKKETDSRDGYKSIVTNTKTWETDINPALKFLNDRWLNDDLKVQLSHFQIADWDIEIQSEDGFPYPEQATFPINLISVILTKPHEVFTFATTPYTGDNKELVKNYHYFDSEEKMLKYFIKFFRKAKVDILTDWNGDGFDLPYFCRRCENLGIDYTKLSPINIVDKKRGRLEYSIAGVAHLDYQKLYKKFCKDPRESYSLNAISMEELKEGKLEYEGTINSLWRNDWNKFVEYNIQDVLLLEKLDQKLRYIEKAITICYSSLIPFDQIFATLPMHTGYALKYLHKRNIVMPVRQKQKSEDFPGGYVFAKPGKHKYVISYDVESLYPTLIRQFNIGPETLRIDPKNTDGLIKTPISKYKKWETANGTNEIGGIYYDKQNQSILSQIVETIFMGRKRDKIKRDICKALENGLSANEYVNLDQDFLNELLQEIKKENGNSEYYDGEQYTKKIIINSLYGSVSSKHFNFYDIRNAMTITLGGQTLIRYLSDNVNEYLKNHFWKEESFWGCKSKDNKLKNDVCVLIDTDSNYLSLKEIVEKKGLIFQSNNEFADWVVEFDKKYLAPFFKKILNINAKKYGVENIINFKREKIAIQMAVLAKKKYVVDVIDNEGERYEEPKLKYTGVEVVRTSTPKFCRNYIDSVVREMFDTDKKTTIKYLKEVKKKFKNESVTNIAFPKGVSDYDKYCKGNELDIPKGCPMHVRASMYFNYLNNKYQLNLEPISNGTKMKYVYVTTQNELHTDVIGFVGNWPEKFNELFNVDYETQWEKSFQEVIQRFFDVFAWGKVILTTATMDKFFKVG